MANEPSRKPSFSLRQRWGIFFSVLVSISAVFALVVMVNYLGARYYVRFPWNMQTRKELSSQTVNLLKNLTNNVNVIIYYNKNDNLYDLVKGLLDEYKNLNHNISVRTVNYLRDPADAAKIKEAYGNLMDPLVDTNAVIFVSNSGTNVVSGETLGKFVYEPMASEGEQRNFRNKLASFNGEACFTDAIFKVINGRPVRAYFFEPLGSHYRLEDQDKFGYQKLKEELQNINIDVTNLPDLHGSNAVPADCKLLIIAPGPYSLDHDEADSVGRYLDHGGHLFVLFSYMNRKFYSGLEPVLARWGIAVGHDVVRDKENHYNNEGYDVVVKTFNKGHPAVNRLEGYYLDLVLPRTIGTTSKNDEMDSSAAKQLAWTGPQAMTNETSVTTGKPVPLIAAVEKGDVKGIVDQGTTRIIAAGDSDFLDNEMIGSVQNKAFARYAASWLVGQSQMLPGIGAQNIKEYTVKMTPAEAENIRWIFLAGMPGAILLFGGLVWLRRRR
jgi:hypothetical protein